MLSVQCEPMDGVALSSDENSGVGASQTILTRDSVITTGSMTDLAALYLTDDQIDWTTVPDTVKQQLDTLDTELKEGDITEKGFRKKRCTLLLPYATLAQSPMISPSLPSSATVVQMSQVTTSVPPVVEATSSPLSSGSSCDKRASGRMQSDIRAEAVFQALAQLKGSQRPPTGGARNSQGGAVSSATNNQTSGANAATRVLARGDTFSEDDSDAISLLSSGPGALVGVLSPQRKQHLRQQQRQTTGSSEPPDVVKTSDRMLSVQQASPSNTGVSAGGKVSARIQQLLLCLKQPTDRPLSELYADDQEDDVAVPRLSPDAPRPICGPCKIQMTDPLTIPSGLPCSLEGAVQRYGDGTPKALSFSTVSPNGTSIDKSLTFGKFLKACRKISYTLLHKLAAPGSSANSEMLLLKPGDRVGLCIPNHDPLTFVTAFYGCLFAGLVPVPLLEVPLRPDSPSTHQTGFLLGGLNVTVVLTTPSCYATLPKVSSGSAHHHLRPQPSVGGAGSLLPDASSSTNVSGTGVSVSGGSGSVNGGGKKSGGNSNLKGPIKPICKDRPFLKGWPNPIHWVTLTQLHKAPKDWKAPFADLPPTAPCFIESVVIKDKGIVGLVHSKESSLKHCQALSVALQFTHGDVVVCLLDTRREAGLVHAVLTSVFNGIHVITIPQTQLRADPTLWLRTVTKFKATVVLTRSRDLHWTQITGQQMFAREATAKTPVFNLSSVRLLLLADGANPWSIPACDAFTQAMKPFNLKPETVCPMAYSPITGVVSVRRFDSPSGRASLSLEDLSYSVVKLDTRQTNSLVVRDCGVCLDGSAVVVTCLDKPGRLAKVDETGHIMISGSHVPTGFYGLTALSKKTFHVKLNTAAGTVTAANDCVSNHSTASTIGNHSSSANEDDGVGSEETFAQTGLLGFVAPSGLVFVTGTTESLVRCGGRTHQTDDIVATVLAVAPVKFVFRGRVAIFAVTDLLKDSRVVMVAEQRGVPGSSGCPSEDDSFAWLFRVLHAVASVHSLPLYALLLVRPNSLPRHPTEGIDRAQVEKLYHSNALAPVSLVMCPHSAVTNLPPVRTKIKVAASAQFVGSLVQGERMGVAAGPALLMTPSSSMTTPQPPLQLTPGVKLDSGPNASTAVMSIGEWLRQRAATSPNDVIMTWLPSSSTSSLDQSSTPSSKTSSSPGSLVGSRPFTLGQLDRLAERLACELLDKLRGILHGSRIGILVPPGPSQVAAVYACFFIGCVPVLIRPSASLSTVSATMKFCSLRACLTTPYFIKQISKSGSSPPSSSWPTLISIKVISNKRLSNVYQPRSKMETAYLDLYLSTSGHLEACTVTQDGLETMCRSIKEACELYPSRQTLVSLDSFSGLGFLLSIIMPVYCGHSAFLLSPDDVIQSPTTWLASASSLKIRDAFVSTSLLELCLRGIDTPMSSLRDRFDLSSLRSVVVVTSSRPRGTLLSSFCALLAPLGLKARVVNTAFHCPLVPAMCLPGPACPPPAQVWLDARALRHDRVALVPRGSPCALPITEAGPLLPGVQVAIVDPDTHAQLADSRLGEVWLTWCKPNGDQCESIKVVTSHVTTAFQSTDPTQESDSVEQAGSNVTSAADKAVKRLECRLSTPCLGTRLTNATGDIWTRTGWLGFVRRTETLDARGERHDALFLVGPLNDSIMVRGCRHHPDDLESCLLRITAPKNRISESAVFVWHGLLVVVAEVEGPEALCLDLIPAITTTLICQHHIIPGVIVLVDAGVVPINARGEKQRGLLRDAFFADKLNPIYVSYNI